MADKNVVREDVVQVGFEVGEMPFQDIVNEINDLKSTITGSVADGEDSLRDIANVANQTGSEIVTGFDSGTNAINELADNAREMSAEMLNSADDVVSGFEDVTDSLAETSKAVDFVSDSVEKYDNGVDEAGAKTSDFVKKLKEIASAGVEKIISPIEHTTKALGSAEEAGAKFVTKLKDIGKGDTVAGLEDIKDAIKDTEDGFDNAGDTGTDAIRMIADVLSAAGITLTLKGITDATYELADAFSEAESIVVQATGATGDALDSLTDSMMNVYAVSKTGTLDETAAAVGEINTRLGYTGGILEDTTGMFMDFAAVTGSSAASSVRNVTQLMNQWGLSGDKMEETLNKLTYAGQASGINVETLSSQLLSNKAILDELGFSVDEATAMFMNFELAGTNTSQVIMGFRTALSSGAIKSLDDLRAVFKKLTDGTMSAEEASKMFGTRAGVTIKNAAQMGVFSLDEVVEALNNTDGLLTQTAENAQTMGQKWDQSTKGIKAAFTTAVQPTIEKITDSLTGMLSSFGEFLNNHPAIVKGIMAIVVALGTLATGKVIASTVSNIGKISSVFGGIGKASKSLGKESGGGIGGIMGIFESLAKAKPTTILKGIANLAIIIGGLTVLAVGLMAIAPYVSKLTDIKSIMQFIAVIGLLGLVGSALSLLAGMVGNIPVSSVALGLANIAIIVAGMSALFLLIGATSLIDFDLNRILQIVKIIAVLGTVGAALSVFAGIVGLIPIPVVLLGLANIALILGGLSAIIIGFGALSSIPHFDDFISKGGETLANLFNTIGKIAGSLVGGIGEGVTNSLPKIGENLSIFAESLKPLISTFNGADMSNIGDFFSSIGSFMLTMAGNDILSFFTGGPDFVSIGKELSAFADSAEGFFTKVAGFPDNGFSNATALFQSLADIGNVPNTGGIAQWFSGTSDFGALAKGLQQLSDESVLNFFRKVADIPAEGFENAKALFQSLADIGNVPNSGGIAQWFSGTNDFTGLAKKLPPFGEAMAAFYNSIAVIGDFNKISQLFETLHNVSQMEIGNLANKGTDLTNFMNNAKGFFTGAGEVVAQLEAVNSVAAALQNFFAIVANIVDTSLTNINDGLNITVALIQSSTNDFTMFGMAIVTASNTGAAAFLYFQTTSTASLETLRMSTTTARMAISTEFERLARSIKSKCTEVISIVNNTANRIRSAFDGINLSSTGANIMNGLINGVKSKEGELMNSLNELANQITGTLNSALEIHSPSRITYRIGAFLAMGGIKGILDNIPKAERASEELATAYTPNSYETFNNRNSHTEYNTYSPQFNLTINGGDDERRLRQKVKQWVKEGMDEAFDSMLRRTEPIPET